MAGSSIPCLNASFVLNEISFWQLLLEWNLKLVRRSQAFVLLTWLSVAGLQLPMRLVFQLILFHGQTMLLAKPWAWRWRGGGASAPWGLGGLQVQRVLRQVPPPAAPGDRLICLVQLKITRSDDALKCIHIIAHSCINYFADCLAPFMTYMLPDL